MTKPLSIQLLPFYHGSDHPFNEGDTVTGGWATRSRIIAGLYGNRVYEVEPNNRRDPDYGGHRIIREVPRHHGDEYADTESIGRWEVDKDDPAWDFVREHPSYR